MCSSTLLTRYMILNIYNMSTWDAANVHQTVVMQKMLNHINVVTSYRSCPFTVTIFFSGMRAFRLKCVKLLKL